MKNFKSALFTQILVLTLALLAVTIADAQQQPRPAAAPPANAEQRAVPLWQQLNLSPDQINQIKNISRDTRDEMRNAVQRQREARRALDAAIYADAPNEQEVELRSIEFAEAQAAVTKLHTHTEFLIRQVLTKDQLVQFLELRRRAALKALQKRPNQQLPPNGQTNQPNNKLLKNRP